MTGPARVGLWLLGLCSVLDVAALALTDGTTPPRPVAIAAAALGIVSLVLVARALRGGGIRLLIGLRILSALSAVPAFFATAVPAPAVAAAAVVVVLNVVGVLLVGGASRRVEVTR
jgi:hypothetical protein